MRYLLFTAVLLSSAPAQGILPLSETYRVGQIATELFTCAPVAIPDIFGCQGTLTFDPNGTYIADLTEYEVCASGAASSTPDSGNGIYHVLTDGRLTLDSFPALPGTETDTLNFMADRGVATLTRQFEEQTDALVAIAVALSSGKDNSSLFRTYYFARLVLRNDGTHSMRTEKGTLVFDGFGRVTESADRHSVPLGGSATDIQLNLNSESYTVDPDGTLTIGAGIGAVSPDDEVLFWSRSEGAEVELTVAVRKRPDNDYNAAMVRGDWSIAAMDTEIGSGAQPDGPFLSTTSGTFSLTPQIPAPSDLSAFLLSCETSASLGFTECEIIQFTDTYSLPLTGLMDLGGIEVGVSADATFFIGTTETDDGGGLILGMSRCRWPTPFGEPTPGTDGFGPEVIATGGFPYAGNPNFGLVLTGGLSGAPAALVLSPAAAPAGGIPLFGGTVWIDPFQPGTVTLPITLSGPAGIGGIGAGGILFPLPAQPALGGATFYIQGVVIDPGAPMGFSFTRGLELGICR